MKKQKIKKTEARILVYLDNVDIPLRYAKAISMRLGIEYNFLIQRLSEMHYKEWIHKMKKENKKYYTITIDAPIEQAKQILGDEKNE